MKNIFSVILVLAIFFTTSVNGNTLSSEDISAKSAVVICAETGEIVFEKNAYEQLPMASTTKIMTSILALEYGASEEFVLVNDEMISVEGSSIGLLSGDKISLKTLVKGMLLESGNDAANTTAVIVGGTISDFVALMNYKAKEIGMYSTSFETPSGLDGENHFSTAFDMAILGAYAIRNPLFKETCSSQEEVVYYGNEPYRRVFSNNNKLLKLYNGAFGIKTGFTKKSGRCLVSAVEKDGKTLVAVTLNAYDDWNDHIKMYDSSFDMVQSVDFFCDLEDVNVKIVGGTENAVGVHLSNEPKITTTDDNFLYTSKIYLKPFEYAPVDEGDVLGFVEFYDGNGVNVVVADICADSSVPIEVKVKEENILDKIKKFVR